MNIVEQCVCEILKMVQIDDQSAQLNIFAYGKTDRITLTHSERMKISDMKPHPGYVHESEEGEEILGTYTPMQSPGIIALNSSNLGSYFWHLLVDILDQDYYIDKRGLERLAYMATIKTYSHEQFHHFADVTRHIFGCRYDRNIEEALAVAHSYLEITGVLKNKWNSKIGPLDTTIYRLMLQSMFRYSQPGYKDWVNYQTMHNYHSGLASYLTPPATATLEKSGINIAIILNNIQTATVGQGVIEVLN